MAPSAFCLRTLATGFGLSLAARAAGSQADVMNATMLQQHGRRLQSTAPCLWSNSKCSINPAYFNEKAAALPQGSALKQVATIDASCGTLKDSATCIARADCKWNDGPKTCNVNVDKEMVDKIATALFDAATCGTSDGANFLKAMTVAQPCDGLSQTDCTANTKCKWSTKTRVVGTNCTQVGMCDQADKDSDKAATQAMCPSTYNQAQAAADCAKTTSDEAALLACTMKGCPLMANYMTAEADATATCTPLTTQATCTANSKCVWQGSSSSGTCQPNVDMASIFLKDVPDACKLKGIIAMGSKCSHINSQASCTGDCSWQARPSCDGSNQVQTSSTCAVDPAKMAKSVTDAAGSGPAGLIQQAQTTCMAATSQAACTAVARPTETATVAGATRMWLAAPSLLAALLAVSAGVHLL